MDLREEPRGEATGEDAAFLQEGMGRAGAVVGGRSTYEAARHWGDENPFGVPMFIVTHRPEEEPDTGEFTFVDGVEDAVRRAVEAAGDRDVSVMGGADVIRQALAAGIVDELIIVVAPVVLGEGKGLFDGFERRSTSSTSACASRRWRRSSPTGSESDDAGARR